VKSYGQALELLADSPVAKKKIISQPDYETLNRSLEKRSAHRLICKWTWQFYEKTNGVFLGTIRGTLESLRQKFNILPMIVGFFRENG